MNSFSKKSIKESNEFLKVEKIRTSVGTISILSAFSEFDEKGNLIKVLLDKPQVIKTPLGLLKAKDHIGFYPNGNLQSLQLYRPYQIKVSGNSLKPSSIRFYNTGEIEDIKLNKPQEINTSYGKLKINELSLYSKGNFSSIKLSSPQRLNTHLGLLMLEDMVCFSRNGIINFLSLYKPQKVNTPIGLVEAEQIRLHENGKIFEIYLKKPCVIELNIGKLKIKYISFDENGSIEKINLQDFQEVKTPIGNIIFEGEIFFSKGKICFLNGKFRNLKIDSKIGELKVKDFLSFHDNGKIDGVCLAKPKMVKTKIGNFYVDFISFFKNDEIEEINLYKPYKINTAFGKLTIKSVTFYDNGKVKSYWFSGSKNESIRKSYFSELGISMLTHSYFFNSFSKKYHQFSFSEHLLKISSVKFSKRGKIEEIEFFCDDLAEQYQKFFEEKNKKITNLKFKVHICFNFLKFKSFNNFFNNE